MNCPPDPGLLVEYAQRRLASARAIALERHLGACETCAGAADSYASLADCLDEWGAPAVSTDFNRRLWRRIDAAESTPFLARLAALFPPGALGGVLAIAAAAVVLTAGFLYDHPAAPAPLSPGISSVEAEQAERSLEDLQLLRQFDAAVTPPPAANVM